MSLSIFTLAERPDLEEEVGAIGLNLPGFMAHDEVDNRYWERLPRDFPAFQLAVCEGGAAVAAGYTIPLSISPEDLPERGWDAALEGGFEDFEAGRSPNVLCALLAKVDPGKRGRGTSREVLRAMRNLASEKGLPTLIAPVRPTMKSRYPLAPMERYARWRREDDLLFDPWMRVHERLGAKVARVAPESCASKAPSPSGKGGRRCVSPRAVST